VISNAASTAPNVVGLVFVAAFAPEEGERLGDVDSGSKVSVMTSALVPLQYPTGDGSHVIMVSQPAAVADVILTAAAAVAQPTAATAG